MMRTFRFTLGNFQLHNTVLTTVTMQYITPSRLIYFITGSLYLFNPTPPHLWQLPICSLYEFGFLFFSAFFTLIKVRSHSICLSLTYLSIMPLRSFLIIANDKISFFVAKQYSVVYTCHVFFMHFSVSGHLDYIYVLAIINNAAMNVGVHMSFQDSNFVSFHKFHEVELLDHKVIYFILLISFIYSLLNFLESNREELLILMELRYIYIHLDFKTS